MIGLPFRILSTIAVALFIASIKSFLVAGYFMHLLSEKKTIYLILSRPVPRWASLRYRHGRVHGHRSGLLGSESDAAQSGILRRDGVRRAPLRFTTVGTLRATSVTPK